MNESEQGGAERVPLSTHVTTQTSTALKSAIVRTPLTVSPDSKLIDAIAQMSGVRTHCATGQREEGQQDGDIQAGAMASCVLVVKDGKLQGILTERDVVRLGTQPLSLEKVVVQEVMTRQVVTLRESAFTDVFSAINLLNHYRIRHIPVLNDQEQLVGLVTHESLRQIARPMDLLRVRQVSEVMTHEVVCAACDCSMLTIAQLMADHRVSSVVIVQPGDNLSKPGQIPLGILTERDIVQFLALGLSLEIYLAQSLMSTPMFTVRPDDSLWTVQLIMEQRLICRLAVTNEQGELLGIVTQTSLLQALNPLEIYKLAEGLEQKVLLLEAEKFQWLTRRNIELEQQVEARTSVLKRKVEREQLVTEIATQVRSSLSLAVILEATVEQVRQVLGCDRVTIWQFEADGQGIAVAESTDSPRSLIGERLPDPCLKPDLSDLPDLPETSPRGQIRIVPDIYRVEMADCHRETLIRLQIRAKILVPLLCGHDLWGWLTATESHHAREWQSEEVDLLQALSVQLAIALQQATTYEQLQKQLLELQDAEDRLRESEHRYITLTTAAPVGIFRADAAGHCTYVNDRWCQIAGLTPETAAGDRWRQGLHPDDRAAIAAEWYQSAQENRPFSLEYRFRRPDGTVTWVYGQSVVEKDAQGQVMGYVGTITDISDRKQAEEALKQLNQDLEAQVEQRTAALRASEATNRATLEAIPDLLLRLRRDGTCLDYIKPSIETEHFLPISQHLSEVIPPDLLQQQLHMIEQAITTQTLQVYEHQFLKHGHVTYEEVRILPLNDQEVLAIVRDISDRKQAEVQLKHTHEELLRANRLKDEFLANMSHELRTPLNAILGMTEGLQEGIFGPIHKKQITALQTIERSGAHLLELINDILDLSKIEAGQVELDYGSISVDYLCKSSLAFIRQQAWQKSIRLETRLPPHLPELWVDERRIRQVLINLLNNAVKFTPEGGCITLAVSPLLGEPALDGRDSLRISVIDTGIGIAPEDIPKLFQPFVQIDGALNRQYNGTGLGLALVKRIVELHGRQIGLTSELGQGSCFTIDLPCASRLPLSPIPATGDRPVALPELNASPDDPAPIASPLILLAEDNAANVITVTSYLSAKGYRILLAKNGQEAVEFAQTQQPDIILMDIQMPGMDGLEAIQQIRRVPALEAIPIIALTALAMTGDRDNCLAAGANDYVAKPVKLKQLTEKIQQFLAPQNSP